MQTLHRQIRFTPRIPIQFNAAEGERSTFSHRSASGYIILLLPTHKMKLLHADTKNCFFTKQQILGSYDHLNLSETHTGGGGGGVGVTIQKH